MGQILDLGKLRLSFQGNWLSTTVYEYNDCVRYGGNVYVYVYPVNESGNLPTNTNYWSLMVEGIKFRGVYSAATAYKIGDGIAYGGKVYIAIADGSANTPPNATYWSQFADGIQYEASYSDATAYQKNDVVTYGGSAYIAKIDGTGNNPINTTYWDKLVDGISFAGAWNSATAYAVGRIVSYGANTFKATTNSTNQNPTLVNGALNSSYWEVFTEGFRTKGAWTTTTEYFINDIVIRGGTTYVCISRHTSGTFATDLSNSKWVRFASGLQWKESWTATTQYVKDDIIKAANGSAYIAILDHTAGSDFSTDVTAGKWQVFVTGGGDVLPALEAGDSGRALTVNAAGNALDWLGATESLNVRYVAPHGTDTPTSGKNLATAYASVRYACDNIGTNGGTIFVMTGVYNEQLPIVVPANVAIVGDNQRTVVIQPKAGNSDDPLIPNNQATMFLMSDGAILNKMTFKGMTGWVPGATANDVTTSSIKGVVVRLNPASPILLKSPYVLECSFIGSGAIGALIDGSVHTSGAKTMIFHGYTVISDNGVGYWVKDGGKSEIVSCFTYYCYFGYTASGGGFIRALNGNNSYGTWGAASRGYAAEETPVVGTIIGQQLNFLYQGGSIQVGDTVTASSGATAVVTNVQASANKVYVTASSGTFTLGNTLTFTSGGTGTVSAGALQDQKGFVLVLTGLTALPRPGASISISGDTYSYVIQSVTGTYVDASSKVVVVLAQEKPTGSASGTGVTIRYKYSQIRLTGHDFLSIGTGGTVTTNYPGTPTQPSAQGNEVDEAYPGRVYFVSTDQDGNFRVGDYFKIDQATGRATLNANAFDLAGLTSLKLGSIGAQLGETINEFSSDATLSGASNTAIPTEYAVKTYVDTNLGSVSGSLNSVLGDVYDFTLPSNQAFTNTSYRASFVTGGLGFVWSLTGTPPTSMTINQSGVLSNGGVAITPGSYNFNIVVTSGTTIATRPITIVSSAQIPTFSSAVFPGSLTPDTAFTINAATATNPANSAITYAVQAGALPSGMTLNTTSGAITGTAGPSNGTTAISYSFTISASSGGYTKLKAFSGSFYYFSVQGQALYGTNVGTGTFTWIAPKGVSNVSVVAVGAGGSGPRSYNSSASGGGGGGLGWKNNISVTPLQGYTVQVGPYGNSTSYGDGNLRGGNSFFISTSTVAGYGGGHRSVGGTGGPNANGSTGGGWFGDGGGAGGTADGSYQPGAGAGGYSGNGGNSPNGTGSGGGGGAGQNYSSTYGYPSGGGVGLLGEGSNGIYGSLPWTPSGGGGGGCGGPGSWDGPGSGGWNWNMGRTNPSIGQGDRGMYGENPYSSTGETSSNLRGGEYGGGGGGQGDSWTQAGGYGGQGGVRIIWGTGRSFPSTNTKNVTPAALP
jgi:hypothetical protein